MTTKLAKDKATPPRKKSVEHIAALIVRQVSYFNGWHVSDETMRKSCMVAAEKIMAYMNRGTQ